MDGWMDERNGTGAARGRAGGRQTGPTQTTQVIQANPFPMWESCHARPSCPSLFFLSGASVSNLRLRVQLAQVQPPGTASPVVRVTVEPVSETPASPTQTAPAAPRPRVPRTSSSAYSPTQSLLPLALPCLGLASSSRRSSPRFPSSTAKSSIHSSLPPIKVLRRRLSRLHVAPTRGPGSFPPWAAAPPESLGCDKTAQPQGRDSLPSGRIAAPEIFFFFCSLVPRNARQGGGRGASMSRARTPWRRLPFLVLRWSRD